MEFVGHPLSGEVKAHLTRDQFCERHQFDPTRPIISFLPGSRHKELVRIFPPMLDAIAMIYRERTDVQFVVVVAPSRSLEEATKIVSKHAKAKDLHSIITLVHHGTRDALAASDVAAVASGTATLEAALLGTPMVVVYKASAINWHTLGRLIEVEHYGLVNLVAGKRVATELMQNDLSGRTLALELLNLLEPKQNQTMRTELSRISERLGEPGASRKAARAILEELGK